MSFRMRGQRVRVCVGIILLAAFTFARPADGQQALAELPPEVLAYADTVLFNGKVLTADDQFSVAEAVAIRDGKFLAVGTTERILKMAGPETRRIDLSGATAAPSFIDTHNHLGDYVLRYMFLEDRGVQYEGELVNVSIRWADREMALRDIDRFVKAAPPGEIVQFSMWGAQSLLRQWRLSRDDLDRLAPNNPLVLRTNILPPVAVNTAMLKWADIPEDTAGAPAPGEIFISGAAAAQLEERLRWAVPLTKLEEWYRKIMHRVNSWGLTSVTTRIRPESFTALREIWLKGQMTVRWRVAFPGPLDIRRTGNLTDIGDDLLRISGASSGGFVPGDPAAAGLWMFDPPLHPLPVESRNPQEWLARWPQGREAMVEAWRYGWTLPNTHVQGDRAAAEFLNAIEEARKNPIVPTAFQRFTIDHNPVVRPEDMQKMKELGVIPSIVPRQLFVKSYRDNLVRAFGIERLSRFIAIKSFLEAGVQPTIEADTGHPNDGRPLWKIEKIVTRKDDEGRVWSPEQKVTRQEALWMNTIWAARYNGDEKILGTIEPGKLADLVVLDGDYLTVPEDQISRLPVRMTLVGGLIVYETNPAGR
ncbi:MAG: amidohydrolase family protein [Acidobacteria bacterium]|nr:amidohydrolase family protein [Acidobacteriota bacterium]MCZ6752727.1 amidohydrolase family protein [Acidobacteriota bacterium]